MLRIGLVGAGWHATAHHAPALRRCAAEAEFAGAVELAGVCDVDVDRAAALAREFGFRRAYESLGAMIPDVDAIVSVVPAATLLTALGPIIDHRRPVLIEKPLGVDLDETRGVWQALDGHAHMVSLNRRFDPAVAITRRWMREQSPARAAHGLMARHDRRERDFVWSTGIHLTDLMCFLVGPLAVIEAGAGIGLLAGGDGVRGTIHFHPASGRVEEIVHFFGDDWAAEITTGTQQPWRVRCWRAGRVEVNAAADPTAPEFERNGTGEETRTFLRAALGRGPFAPTVADAAPGTQLAAALQASFSDPPRHA